MRNITHIIVHCSDSLWGTKEDINSWHKERGWTEIGYNWLILNQFPTHLSLKANKPVLENDGKLVGGRDLDRDGNYDEEVGAHAVGYNSNGLGICLIGDRRRDGTLSFTVAQITTLIDFCVDRCRRYGIPASHILGHNETPKGRAKECPLLDMQAVRNIVQRNLETSSNWPTGCKDGP